MSRNQQLFQQAKQLIPGGVNSPGRAFINVGSNPLFISSGSGPYLTDADDKRYLEYVCSMGANIVGNAHPEVVSKVQAAASKGLGFWLATELEVQLAEKIIEYVPSIDMVRLVNSGTEATMSAIRLARAYTNKPKIIKFDGCYHGHNDAMLVNSGSASLDIGVPSSPGVPRDTAQNTLTAQYNDLESVSQLFSHYDGQVAAVIVEPIAGNMSCVPPKPGFLSGLRELCDQHNALLILDEVMTGFRVALGCAQSLYHVRPDLTTLGKVIGGGLPVGAFGGRRDIMEMIAPSGPVYHAGTLSGNPISVTAGLATLELVSQPGFHEHLQQYGEQLGKGLLDRAQEHGISMVFNHVGGMFGLFFTDQEEVSRFDQVMACNQAQFKTFFLNMLDHGVLLAPSAFECGFLSSAHTEAELTITLDAAEKAFARMKVTA